MRKHAALEFGATVKYLTPMPEDETSLAKATKDFEVLQPAASDIGQVANVAVPGAGTVVSSSARLLGALAQMKINSLPQTAGFQWNVVKTASVRPKKTESGVEEGTMAGLVWSLPTTMFQEFGGRISGSVAVIFVPLKHDSASNDLASGAILARAVVRPKPAGP